MKKRKGQQEEALAALPEPAISSDKNAKPEPEPEECLYDWMLAINGILVGKGLNTATDTGRLIGDSLARMERLQPHWHSIASMHMDFKLYATPQLQKGMYG